MSEETIYDFTKVTRDSKKALTTIRVSSYGIKPFILLAGRTNLDRLGERSLYWRLTARAKEGVTDFEHDSAYIFQIPITAPIFESMDSSVVYLSALLLGREPNDLRLKLDSKYDPTKLKGASRCDGKKYCKYGAPHPLVPEVSWAGPKADPELYRLLIGAKIDIKMIAGPDIRKE